MSYKSKNDTPIVKFNLLLSQAAKALILFENPITCESIRYIIFDYRKYGYLEKKSFVSCFR